MVHYPALDAVLDKAREQERAYDWLGTAETYRRGLALVAETDFLRAGDLQERIGYTLHRAALQSETPDECKARTAQSLEAYEKAKEAYGRLGSPGEGRHLRSEAWSALLGYWLAAHGPERTIKLRRAWQIATAAMNSFDEARDMEEYTRTFDQVAWTVWVLTYSEWSFQDRMRIVQEATELAQKAAEHSSRSNDSWAAARTLTSCALVFALLCRDVDAVGDRERQALACWSRAEALSEKAAYSGIGPSSSVPGLWGDGTDESIGQVQKALEYCKKTNDRFVTGILLTGLDWHLWWKADTLEDPDQRIALHNAALEHAEAAKRELTRVSFANPSAAAHQPEMPYPVHYWSLARVETDPAIKRQLLQKAMEYVPELLARTAEAGLPAPIADAHWIKCSTLTALAQLEARPEAKRALLTQALEHGNEYVRIYEQYWPTMWFFGDALDRLAQIEDQLASLETEPASKEKLLREAIHHKDQCLRVVLRQTEFIERTGEVASFAWFGGYQYEYGGLLVRLNQLTRDPDFLRRAAEVYEQAVDSFRRPKILSRVAEALWKAAQAYDALGEHVKSAERFDAAAATFREAAERLPQLRSLYDDYAAYMQAWSEIEKAREYHLAGEYGSAKGCYKRAAQLHQASPRWTTLAANYSAWAHLEGGEDLSRKEECQGAILSFREAGRLFGEVKDTLRAALGKVMDREERRMWTDLVKASDLRQEYCRARITLEEGRLFSRAGRHRSSAEKYRSAADMFEKLLGAVESVQDKKDIKLILTLTRAWKTMVLAEAEASPRLYTEASQLFEEARELSSDEKAKMLVLGHSRFSLALEAGTRFVDTRDPSLHAAAVQYLESAAVYYLKGGFLTTSEYAKASKLLFDGYAFVDKAAKDEDPDKRAKYYVMAEKVLEASAAAYEKADQPGKQEEVLRLLERVKEERQLALSLTEVLHAPSALSTTVGLSTLAPTYEKAVGLERFEHADVQANLITRRKELQVGEDLDLEIELVNAGRGPAQLIKIEELVPQGFELTGSSGTCRVEDNYLNLKGKRLDPLKTEEVKLILRAGVYGQFILRPRILYLDEDGTYRAHEPPPVEITVRELGLTGWLKGPKKRP